MKRARPKPPKTTAVPDRSVDVALGREAKVLARFLRDAGVEPDLVPDVRDQAASSEWTAARSRPLRRLPAWMVDWACAILEKITERDDRPPGRRSDPAVAAVEFWKPFVDAEIDAARIVARGELWAERKKAATKPEDLLAEPDEEAIEVRAKKLIRRTYPSRKRRGAKSKL